MATTYVVLRDESEEDALNGTYVFVDNLEAANAEKACRIVAEDMPNDTLAQGVTLIAVPARHWTTGRNTFKAETRRRLLRS